MQKFTSLTAVVVPLLRANVDTDAIIPKQFLKSIKRTGFGPHLFDAWRYLDQGYLGIDHHKRPLNPDFVLNQPRFKTAQILLAGKNFGCGSSREHAPWALIDYGIRVVIAPSFADIFYNNCFKNGLLPITLAESVIQSWFAEIAADRMHTLTVDLTAQKISSDQHPSVMFEIDTFRKKCLLLGLDDIALTLQHVEEIRAFEQKHREHSPWLFRDLSR